MKDLGGKPHWAKNFEVTKPEIERYFKPDDDRGEGLEKWRSVRNQVDPKGLFVGPWHRRTVLDGEPLELEEMEIGREESRDGGLLVTGGRGSRN